MANLLVACAESCASTERTSSQQGLHINSVGHILGLACAKRDCDRIATREGGGIRVRLGLSFEDQVRNLKGLLIPLQSLGCTMPLRGEISLISLNLEASQETLKRVPNRPGALFIIQSTSYAQMCRVRRKAGQPLSGNLLTVWIGLGAPKQATETRARWPETKRKRSHGVIWLHIPLRSWQCRKLREFSRRISCNHAALRPAFSQVDRPKLWAVPGKLSGIWRVPVGDTT